MEGAVGMSVVVGRTEIISVIRLVGHSSPSPERYMPYSILSLDDDVKVGSLGFFGWRRGL